MATAGIRVQIHITDPAVMAWYNNLSDKTKGATIIEILRAHIAKS